MKTVILAGGLGTRLQSVVNDVPKPMANINGTPFLELLMQNMLNFGTTEFILCVSYKKDIIINHFGSNFHGVPVKYSVEEEPLGTGGAIKQAFKLYDIDTAIVINGDSFIKMDYAQFYQKYQKDILALALKFVPNASRYGIVQTNNRHITAFNEKSAVPIPGFINAGIYLINRQLFNNYPLEKKFSFEKEILEKHIPELKPGFVETDEYFIDIGIPESYHQACRELKEVVNGR